MEVVSVLSGLTLHGKLKPIAAEKAPSDHCAFLKIRRTLIGYERAAATARWSSRLCGQVGR
jgi:hypothetical protein